MDDTQKLLEKNETPLSPCLQIKYASLKNIGALQQLLGCPIDAIDAYLEVRPSQLITCIISNNVNKYVYIIFYDRLLRWMCLMLMSGTALENYPLN